MTPQEIIAEVAIITGIPAPAITGRRRTKAISRARFLAIAAIRTAFPDWTLEVTGEVLNRTHGSIVNARIRHLEYLKSDRSYSSLTQQICQSLFASPPQVRINQ